MLLTPQRKHFFRMRRDFYCKILANSVKTSKQALVRQAGAFSSGSRPFTGHYLPILTYGSPATIISGCLFGHAGIGWRARQWIEQDRSHKIRSLQPDEVTGIGQVDEVGRLARKDLFGKVKVGRFNNIV